MNLQPIVEGHGEVAALPVLLRRLQAAASVYGFTIGEPVRKPSSDFRDEQRFRTAVALARGMDDCGAILVLFDGDGADDCPKTDAPRLRAWAADAALGTPCEVVVAYREYEAWFLAAVESLRGIRGVRDDAVSHPEPEAPGGAKRHLNQRLVPGRRYAETADQPAMSDKFDLAAAHRACRSFRRLVKAFSTLATALGAAVPSDWPPSDWLQLAPNAHGAPKRRRRKRGPS